MMCWRKRLNGKMRVMASPSQPWCGTWGSSPRPVGSQLAVNDKGTMVGSVSGGCIEGAVIEQAKKVIAEGKPELMEFGVTDDKAWEVGLSCGGDVHVFVEPIK